jgi:RHS repeat-associated protein
VHVSSLNTRILDDRRTKISLIITAVIGLSISPARPADAPPMTVGGQFEVGPTGAATYSIPIIVPPGTAGLAPSLSLNYSSQSGNGIVGFGWSLGGLPSITRCPQTYAQDGVHGSVNYDSNDRYCLDGQRLVKVGGSGGYGAANSEYRTEIDSFSKVIAHNPDDTTRWFEVHTKSGQVLELGNSSDSRIIPVPVAGHAAFTVARAWLANKISDTVGNYLTVTYVNDTGNGQYYPDHILYTANDAAGVGAYNSVYFKYGTSDRGDITPLYHAGSVMKTTKLLSDIKTYTNTTGTGAVTDYKLAYQLGNASFSQLTSVQRCDGSGLCLPATTFTWQTATTWPKRIVVDSTPSFPNFIGPAFWLSADFNGDGVQDGAGIGDGTNPNSCESSYDHPLDFGTATGLVAANKTEVISGTTYLACLSGQIPYTGGWGQVGDYDGDGLADMNVSYAGTLQNDGLGNFTQVTGGFYNGFGGTQAFDFNDDGLSDTSGFDSSTGILSLSIATVTHGWTSHNFTIGGSSSNKAYPQVGSGLGGDIDGDGCTDVAFQHAVNEIFLTCPSLAAGSTVAISIPDYYIDDSHFSTLYFGDFNGDGNSDYFTIPVPNGDSGKLNISSGATPFLPASTLADFKYGVPGNTYLIGDFDGDGKSDVILIEPEDFKVYKWDGTTLTLALEVDVELPQSTCSDLTCPNPNWNGWVQTADVDGDGCTDLVVSQPMTSPAKSYYYKFKCHPPLLMTGISNGIGASTTVSYDRLNKNDFYTKCTGSPGVYRCPGTSYPTQAVDGPIYVVTQVDTSNGLGVCTPVVGSSAPNCFTSKYAYAGAKRDLLGRGFLGFEQVAVTDLQTNVTKTTSYNMLFPYTGTVTEEKRTLGSTVLSDTINSYGTVPAVPVTGTPTFVYLKTTTISANEVDNTALPGSTITHLYPDGSPGYDAYGNPTYIQTNLTDLSSKTTINAYSNDPTNWIIGRLTNTTVTSVVVNSLGTSTITRTSSFGYTSNGVLDSEIIEPGSSGGCNGNNTSCTLDTEYPSANIDAFGHPLVKQVSGASFATRTASVTYDALGQFEASATNAITTPGPQTEYFDYTGTYGKSFGVMTGHTDLNGLVTNWSYDSFGRRTNETRPGINGTQTDISYQLCGGAVVCPTNGAFVVTVTPYNYGHAAQNGPITKTYYDALSRIIATDVQGFDGPSTGCTLASPCWIRTETQYDANGNVGQTSRPYFLAGGIPKWTTYSYGAPDPYGRPSLVTGPDGSHTSYAYTGLGSTGSQTSVTNALTQTTVTVKNAQGLVASVKNALNKTTSYAYDAYGDLLRVTDPLGNHIDNTYDIRGNKTASADPDMGAWSYTYDALGELLSQTDAKAQTTTLAYDALGRVTSRSELDQTSTWTYDTATHGVGFLKSATGSNAGYTRAQFYDTQGRPSKTKLVINGTTYLYVPAYNPDNRLDTLTYPSGLVVQYVYTTLGYLQQMQDKSTGAVLWTANARDAELHLTDQSAGNHARAIAVYDPNTGLVQQIRAGASEADDSSVAHFDYAFDAIGNLKSRSDSYESYAENFCYDGLNRLTAYSVGGVSTTDCHSGTTGLVKTASYDDIGNLTNKSDLAGSYSGNYTYPASAGAAGSHPHAVTSINGMVNGILSPHYKYDANGNMICEYTGGNCSGSGVVRDTETYWASNMPKTLTQGTISVAFVYDSEHARITQAVTNGSSAVTTTYLNDPMTGAMSEMVASGGTPTWNDYLMADGKLLGERNCTGAATSTSPCTGATTTEYFLLDHLQSVSVVTDGTTGAVAQRESFDAWGRQRNANGTDDTACALGSSSPNKRRFTSQEQIDELCLINLNARIYDPTIGRFMVADSVVPDPHDGQSYNRYTYTENRPLSFTDPTGHLAGAPNISACGYVCAENDRQHDPSWHPEMAVLGGFSVTETDNGDGTRKFEISYNSERMSAPATNKNGDGAAGIGGSTQLAQGSTSDPLTESDPAEENSNQAGASNAFAPARLESSEPEPSRSEPESESSSASEREHIRIVEESIRVRFSAGPGKYSLNPTLVIGRGADLGENGENLGPNEVRLVWDDVAETKDEALRGTHMTHQMNQFVLRAFMSMNMPIRDASPGNEGGMYTQFERSTLQNSGWLVTRTNDGNVWWIPPLSFAK